MITVQANTISEAISQAAEKLNVEESEMYYEVMQEEKNFPFKKPAIIKAYAKTEIEIIEPVIPKSIVRIQNNGDNSKTIPKCPTCGSTNISKISAGERIISVGVLGLGSNKINKSYKCNNCKYTW